MQKQKDNRPAKAARQTAVRYAALAALAGLIAAVWLALPGGLLTLEGFRDAKDTIDALIVNHYYAMLAGYMIAYAVAAAASIPAATFLTLLGGYMFGTVAGGLAVAVSATVGACGIFMAVRAGFADRLAARAGPYYARAEAQMRDNAFHYILFLRLVPVFPFVIVNILPALFTVRLRDYAFATGIGILPATFVYTYLGRSLAELETVSDLISGRMLAALTLLGFLALVPILIKKLSKRRPHDHG